MRCDDKILPKVFEVYPLGAFCDCPFLLQTNKTKRENYWRSSNSFNNTVLVSYQITKTKINSFKYIAKHNIIDIIDLQPTKLHQEFNV